MRELEVTVEPAEGAAEVVCQIEGTGDMEAALDFPGPFETKAGELLILPVNEGISYPVDDLTFLQSSTRPT